MKIPYPNIFTFAKSELSQDAFWAWFFSWAEPSEETHSSPGIDGTALREAARKLLAICLKISGRKHEITQKQIDAISVERISLQEKHTDLIIRFQIGLSEKWLLCIEDKTNTTRRGQQLEEYSDYCEDVCRNERRNLALVYFKSGSLERTDINLVGGFQLLGRNLVLEIMKDYRKAHPLVADYLDWLSELKEADEEIEHLLWTMDGVFSAFNSALGQRLFLENTFPQPDEKQGTGESWGTSSGRPWRHFRFGAQQVPGTNSLANEMFFWRLDQRQGKAIVSLRKYWKHDQSPSQKIIARHRFHLFVTAAENAVNEVKSSHSLSPSPRSCQSSAYFEQELILFFLGPDNNHPAEAREFFQDLHPVMKRALEFARKIEDRET